MLNDVRLYICSVHSGQYVTCTPRRPHTMHGTDAQPGAVHNLLKGNLTKDNLLKSNLLKGKQLKGNLQKGNLLAMVTSPRLWPPVATTLWNAPVTRRRTAAVSASLSCEDLHAPLKSGDAVGQDMTSCELHACLQCGQLSQQLSAD